MRLSKTLGTLVLLSLVSNAKAEDKQPNIILFLVDDMGWQDTSVPFYTRVTSMCTLAFRSLWLIRKKGGNRLWTAYSNR